jgi:hypothetical protein
MAGAILGIMAGEERVEGPRAGGPLWAHWRGPASTKSDVFSFSFKFSNKLEFALVQNTAARAQKILNKIWICR